MGLNDTIGEAVQRNRPAVTLDDSLRTVIERMTEGRTCAVVVKSGSDLVGIITELDVINHVARGDDLDATKASRCMTACELITDKAVKTPCVQLDEGETVKNALAIMAEAGVHHLLVSGAGKEAVGIVSARDLLSLAIA